MLQIAKKAELVPAGQVPPSSKHFKKIIKWVDGAPVPAYRQILTNTSIQQLPLTVISMPYERTLEEELNNIDPEFEGLSNGEVMLIRLAREAASGDPSAMTILLDRILGKPKFQAEIKTLSMNYQDFLEELARRENTGRNVNDL